MSVWEKSEDKNADYYICKFNYYLTISQNNTFQSTGEKPQHGNYFTVKDSIFGFVSCIKGGGVSENTFRQGIMYIDKGIARYPSR